MAFVAGNKDPYGGDTAQAHDTHTQAGSLGQFLTSQVTFPTVPKVVQPSTFGFKGWSYDFGLAQTATGAAQGFTFVTRVECPGGATGVTKLSCLLGTAGTSVTDFQGAIYDSTGARLQVVTGQQALLVANTMVTLTIPSTNITADYCYVGFYSAAVSGPQYVGIATPAAGQSMNGNLTTPRSGSIGSAPPASFTLSGGLSVVNTFFWVGIS